MEIENPVSEPPILLGADLCEMIALDSLGRAQEVGIGDLKDLDGYSMK